MYLGPIDKESAILWLMVGSKQAADHCLNHRGPNSLAWFIVSGSLCVKENWHRTYPIVHIKSFVPNAMNHYVSVLEKMRNRSKYFWTMTRLRWRHHCPKPIRHTIDILSNRLHYCDAIMGAVASQITSLTIVYTTVYSDVDQSKHQSFASLAFVWGIHRGPVNSPHKWPVTRKMIPFDDVIMGRTWFK